MTTPLIELRNLRKSFGSRVALRGLDLQVDTPQILGVVGPDGAGKTTLLRALAGLLDITADVARVLGVDLRADVTPLKMRTGYVPQSFSLHRELSVSENLRFTARLHRIPTATFNARAAALLQRTGLTPFGDRPAGALSGGMKQKLAIANALLPTPALIILDEPTAGVDVLARREIWTMLREVCATTLVVVSTSYLDEADATDMLLYLDDGRVVATGTPNALRTAVPLEQFRLWGDAPRAIAALARALPGVIGVRAVGPFARIDVRRSNSADTSLRTQLAALPGVALAEEAAVDMESTLLALSQGAAA